jgi:hypothetical protein
MKKSTIKQTVCGTVTLLVGLGFAQVSSAQVRVGGFAPGQGAGVVASGPIKRGIMIMGIGDSLLKAGDADADGGLSLTELKKLVAAHAAAWDADTNNLITQTELSAGLATLFPSFEGAVSGVSVAPQGAAFADAEAAPPPPPPPHIHIAEGLIRFCDTDGDTQISMDELNAATERWFQNSDTDGNSQLTAEEMNVGFRQVAGPPAGTRVIIRAQ